MNGFQRVCVGVACAATLATAHAQSPAPQRFTHGLFSDVPVYRPAGAVQQFVLLLVEGQAASEPEQALRRSMLAGGAVVAEVPMSAYLAQVRQQREACSYAGGDFDNFARHVQARLQLPAYFAPMVVGAGDYAAYAYGLVAQSPPGSFGTLLTPGFCPRLQVQPPLCAVNKLAWRVVDGAKAVDLQPAPIGVPWIAQPGASCAQDAPGFVAQVPQARWLAQGSFDAAYAQAAAGRPALDVAPAQLTGIPVVEVPAQKPGPRFAVLLSGDGGWAGIDKDIAAALAAQGVPVAGFDSLRYFWNARTPEGLAADLDRLIRYYAAKWQRSEVILIGFSQGADVLPFALNRLPERTRAAVKLTALLAPAQKASFEFKVSNWLGPSGDKPVLPEAQKLQAAGTLCVHGKEEKASLCPQLAPRHARVVTLPGAHHLDGDYVGLAGRILGAVGP
ncbi:virulence factor family protein [Pseudorhodoferax sp. Leaf267]|uniref:virulence factor family protein n=1 Tax=Pseudorhodoferax sp. Leaf267 TaxID=1736316 RepID=UPI0006F4761E|nr:AcvB/VirJ family lysyl-phosphatidylglycerol hydrolase [Pseudorhodoferax sp. Leaf267]